jgi:glycosyltransferase involved in cell wall biosynthesis
MQLRFTVRRTARAAAHIITDSNASREDILSTYGLSPTRVTVTPLSASSHYSSVEDAAEIDRVRNKYGITGNYILAVGSIQPRKNIPRLICAYVSLARERVIEPMPRLVVVGKSAWLFEETLRAAKHSAARDKIVFTGYVPQNDLPALYTAARCFVYPSYFEGFGIPLLEAMRCGTPTISADRSCFPEVVGEAGLMVNPFDENAIAAAITRLLLDSRLHEDLRAKGLERAALFDWKETARKTIAVYENVNLRRTASLVS